MSGPPPAGTCATTIVSGPVSWLAPAGSGPASGHHQHVRRAALGVRVDDQIRLRVEPGDLRDGRLQPGLAGPTGGGRAEHGQREQAGHRPRPPGPPARYRDVQGGVRGASASDRRCDRDRRRGAGRPRWSRCRAASASDRRCRWPRAGWRPIRRGGAAVRLERARDGARRKRSPGRTARRDGSACARPEPATGGSASGAPCPDGWLRGRLSGPVGACPPTSVLPVSRCGRPGAPAPTGPGRPVRSASPRNCRSARSPHPRATTGGRAGARLWRPASRHRPVGRRRRCAPGSAARADRRWEVGARAAGRSSARAASGRPEPATVSRRARLVVGRPPPGSDGDRSRPCRARMSSTESPPRRARAGSERRVRSEPPSTPPPPRPWRTGRVGRSTHAARPSAQSLRSCAATVTAGSRHADRLPDVAAPAGGSGQPDQPGLLVPVRDRVAAGVLGRVQQRVGRADQALHVGQRVASCAPPRC